MATSDIYEVVDEQSMQGQIINNVYHFMSTDGTQGAQGLADWFEAEIVPAVAGQQAALLSHINVRVRNLFNPNDIAENPISVPGTLTSLLEMPEFIAYSCRFDHNLGGTRPGQKRWAGGVEDDQDAGVWSAARVTSLQTLADRLVNPLTPATPFNHVIVDRVCDEFDATDPTRCIRWRMPATQAEANSGEVTSGTVQVQVSTQNSRKWYT